MAERVQIGEHKSSFGKNKDCWYFVVADDGKQYVEHEWSYADEKSGSKGTQSTPVDDFLAGDYDDNIRDAVRDEVKRRHSSFRLARNISGQRREN